jgi:uncharacterized protein YcbK (DUF882 family)
MTPRLIVHSVIGIFGLLGVHTLVKGPLSPSPSLPPLSMAIREQPRPLLPAEDPSRQRIVIEPLPVPTTAIKLVNVNTKETTTLEIGNQGQVTAAQAAEVEQFFRCRRTGRHKEMAPGVLALLVDVARRWPGRTLEVVSGFRAPPYGAPHSKHFRGQAIDLRVRGVRTAALRDFVWRTHHEVGVGYYRETNFVHMDWRPGELDTAWTARDEEGANEYHPRWAWRARHSRKSGRDRSPSSLATAPTVANAI